MTPKIINILCLEDSADDLFLIRNKLTSIGLNVNIDHVAAEEEYTEKLRAGGYDIIFSDFNLPGFNGLKALFHAKKICPEIPFICVSGAIGEDFAVEMMQYGAADYILKDRLHKLPIALQRVIREVDDRRSRMEAEKMVKESETRFRDIVMSMYDVVWEVDREWWITYSSENLHTILGYHPDEVIGKSILDFAPPENKEVVGGFLANTLDSCGIVKDLENWNPHKDGSRVCLLSNGFPIFDDKGTLTGYRGIHKDITKNKLQTLELIEAKERAEAGSRLKTAFMNNISHELRTPLNGILGFTQLLLEPDLSNEEKVHFQSLLTQSSNRLIGTITNYMDISMIVSGNMAVHMKPTRLSPLFTRIQEKYLSVCSEKKLFFSISLPEGTASLEINTDGELLQKTLEHMLDNAVKFTPKGEICLGLTLIPGSIRFFVRDTGIGVPKEAHQRIFEPFMQEESSLTRGYEGSGLGLSIAAGIVKLLGGETQMESEKGAGSTFSFTLPCEIIPSSRPSATEPVQAILPVANSVILVAEDDEANLIYFENILRNEGLGVITASNGQDAIDRIHEHPEISLVLMDMKMPLMDGMEATKRIKSIRRELPVVAITAFAMSGDKKKILEAGCDGYLSKPLTKEVLLAKVKEFI